MTPTAPALCEELGPCHEPHASIAPDPSRRAVDPSDSGEEEGWVKCTDDVDAEMAPPSRVKTELVAAVVASAASGKEVVARKTPTEERVSVKRLDSDCVTESGCMGESFKFSGGSATSPDERSPERSTPHCHRPEIWTPTEDQMLTELVEEVAAQLTVAKNIPDRLVGLIGFRYNALSGQSRPAAMICNRWKSHLRFSPAINPSIGPQTTSVSTSQSTKSPDVETHAADGSYSVSY